MNGQWRCDTHKHTHTHNGILSSIKKNKMFPFAATWMNLKGIMLWNKSDRERPIFAWYHLSVQPKKYNKLRNVTKKEADSDIENKLVAIIVGRSGNIGMGESESESHSVMSLCHPLDYTYLYVYQCP